MNKRLMVLSVTVAAFSVHGIAKAGLLGDFNDGTLSGWTVDDILGGSAVIGWTNNINIDDGGDIRANFTTGDSGAAMVDSDAIGAAGAGAYNIALVSPVFTVNAGDTLEFWHMFRSLDAGDFGHVEITTDGTTWSNLATYADTVGTIPTFPYTTYTAGGVMETLSLTGFEGTSTQVRFRYEGDSWDWWWQVDNVSSVAVPAPGALALVGLAGLAAGRRRRA